MLVAGGAGGGPTGVLLQKDVVALQHEGGGGGGGGVAVLSLCTEIKALFICLLVRVRLFSKLKGRKKTAESQAGDCCRRHF